MKIEIVGDVHISKVSSIVMGRGDNYSQRLENCIQSLNWAERQAEENGVDKIIYVGDVFDKAEVNAEEATALKEVKWSNKPHIVLVGNHEIAGALNEYDTAQLLGLLDNFEVIKEPAIEYLGNTQILYLPYIDEDNRKSMSEYGEDTKLKKLVISHNDLKGICYGLLPSMQGFELDDIENNCDLYINGHLHNGQEITKKIINIGNLTGQSFNEDAYTYGHHIMIINDDLSYKYIENPYAFNFYKFNVTSEEQIDNLNLKNNAVVNIKCEDKLIGKLRKKLDEIGVIAHKVSPIIRVKNETEEDEETIQDLYTIDYVEQFRNYVLENLGENDLILEELREILS